ncbi:hypothetical protein [Inediibacterium massiliense]|uniref:hypothetical protein n=1 Tax=Inediibacterium massiliense TaxID=1658111 RepID=UPI0018FF0D1A|nr:hypothetical protein [Inediibacterium massiliense]
MSNIVSGISYLRGDCMKNPYPKLLEDQDIDNLIDLVEIFLEFCDDLLNRSIITQDQYLEITYQKRKFLQQIHHEEQQSLSIY